MPESTIAIIGAGIAGLAAGCYGQMNGYQTRIFELHDKPGGLCTSWQRKGYTFDGCIHWLVGSGEGSPFNHVWRELGAVQGRPFVDHEEFMRVEGVDGRAFVVYTDIDRLEAHMREMAPQDQEVIDEFIRVLRRFSRMSNAMADPTQTGGPLRKLIGLLRMLPHLGALQRYSQMPVQDFAARFTDPFLCRAFGQLFDMPDFPMVGMLMTLAWMDAGDAGYPIGGSLAFARAIERRYLGLGGEISYNSRVTGVLVESDDGQDVAVGLRLADGSEYRADRVISAADGRATIFDMLDGRYVDERVQRYYDELPTFPPLVQVSLGVARDLSNEPHSVTFPLAEPILFEGKPLHSLSVRHFACDPTMAPAGHTVVEVLIEADYDYWQALAEDRERYDAEKQELALAVMARLAECLPGFQDQVMVADVATPLTTERYTGNWRGSMEGWLLTTGTARLAAQGMRQTLPGLARFAMCGQWVEPGGGVPTAALSGRKVIGLVCKEDGKRFRTSLPDGPYRDGDGLV